MNTVEVEEVVVNAYGLLVPESGQDTQGVIEVVTSLFERKAGSFVFGMLPTLALFLVLWLRCLEKYPWKTVLTVSAIIMAVVLAVFVFWLDVMFPNGLILDMLLEG